MPAKNAGETTVVRRDAANDIDRLAIPGKHSGQDLVPANEVMIERGQGMYPGHDQYAIRA